NLMLTNQGVIKILDFGIAKVENATLTQAGMVVGTPSHMAPEQVAGKKVDHRADIFALGSVFYELVTREKPFRGDIATILYKIMSEDPVAPSLINPALPGGIDAIIRKALAKDPKERFQTCDEMRNAFLEQAALLNLTPAAGVPGIRVVAKSAPLASATIPQFLVQYSAPQRSRRAWSSMVLGLVLAILGTTSWAFYTRSHTGAFPPPIRNLVEAFQRIRLAQPAGNVSDQTTQKNAVNDPNHAATTGGTQASGATNKADGVQTQAVPESSGASAAPSQEPVEGESSTGQPATDGAPVSAAATTSGPSTPGQAQALQSSGASGQPVVALSPTAFRQNDKNQPATENARAPNAPAANGDSATPPVPSGADEG